VRQLVAEDHLSALAILHDLNLASLYCDELVLLAEGRIVARGRPQEVLTHERIAGAYGTDVLVLPHPQTGRPVIVPEVGYTMPGGRAPADLAAGSSPTDGRRLMAGNR
jgi:iron complex transport system ATP-binding protein